MQREKLLFYRGIANFTPPIVARLDGDQVRVTNVASVAVPQVMLFENTGGKIAYQVHGPLDAGTSITLARSLADGTDGGLRRALLTTLVAQGLYDKEASAMLATWDDSWFEPGLRVISIVPAAVTDEVMPMSIEPHPDKIERVLVGRTEIITAELEREVIADMRGIDPPFYANVSAAMAKHGRFAMAALKHVVQAVDRRRAARPLPVVVSELRAQPPSSGSLGTIGRRFGGLVLLARGDAELDIVWIALGLLERRGEQPSSTFSSTRYLPAATRPAPKRPRPPPPPNPPPPPVKVPPPPPVKAPPPR
ncbi:MAG: hypothetical protein U1E76_12755 [Planctomycetota bacterium]